MTHFDFGDGKGPVPAHQHINPDGSLGGWVADTASVYNTAFVASRAKVYNQACVRGCAIILGDAVVYENALVECSARVREWAKVGGNALVSGCATIGGSAIIWESASITDRAHVYGDAVISGRAAISGSVSIRGSSYIYGEASVSVPITFYDLRLDFIPYQVQIGRFWLLYDGKYVYIENLYFPLEESAQWLNYFEKSLGPTKEEVEHLSIQLLVIANYYKEFFANLKKKSSQT